MIKVATVGVHDHMENMTPSEVILRNLISKAAPTARHSTRTAKIAALLVSVNFVNILQASFISYVCDIPHSLVACRKDLADTKYLSMAYLLTALASHFSSWAS
jgi:hypothetical protein